MSEDPEKDLCGQSIPVGVINCEEAWNEKDFWEKHLYSFDPVEEMVKSGAKYLIIFNASPYRKGVAEVRRKMIINHAKKHNVGIAYANMVGYNDEVGFDGNSFAVNAKGEIIAHSIAFAEDLLIFDTELSPINIYPIDWQAEVLMALTLGIKDYFGKQNINGPAIIGLSGGIDSAIVAYLAVQALGKDRVIGVGMPSEFSSNGSVSDAEKIATTLGIHFTVQPIKRPHDEMRHSVDRINLNLNFKDSEGYINLDVDRKLLGKEYTACVDSGITDENLQARIRGIYLMALSNYYNGLVLSTGNKSEMAVGYCVDKDSLIWTLDGVLTAKELYNKIIGGENVRTGDKWGANKFVDAHKSHKAKATVIRTKIGSEMRVSADHEIKMKMGVSLSKYAVCSLYLGSEMQPLLEAFVSDIRYIEIKETETTDCDEDMYDFTMSGLPEYNINGHDIHNCTMYGDLCGGLAPLSDVFKTDVYDLCRYINEQTRMEVIPNGTITKPPSAELRKGQKDQDSLPPYWLLDAALYRFVDEQKSPRQIVKELYTDQKAIEYLAECNRMLDKDILWICNTVYRVEYKHTFEDGLFAMAGTPDLKQKQDLFKLVLGLSHDFCPGGALAVAHGDEVVEVANQLIANGDYNIIIATQDWHPTNHGSFASTNSKKPFEIGELGGLPQVMWPDHCVQGTKGAELRSDLNLHGVTIFRKGTDPFIDSYKCFL
ncbi:unnamed protein product [Sphagnum jensenii]